MTLFGWLDDMGGVIRWTDYPPPDGRSYVTKRVPTVRSARPTIETDGIALW